ncbi:MAG: C40 family peptidase [Mobilitalea sp.]
MQKNPRLRFTEEERADPLLKKKIKKAEQAADKAEKAQAKIPKKRISKKEHITDSKTGKHVVRLQFEEVDKKKLPTNFSHAVKKAPARAVGSSVHRQIRDAEEDNVGVEGAHKVEQAGESGLRIVSGANRSIRLRPYKKVRVAEKKLEKANVKALYQKQPRNKQSIATNPMSRFQQKRAIKKQYTKMRLERMQKETKYAGKGAKAVTKITVEILKKVGAFVAANAKIFLIVGLIIVILVVVLNFFSSCSIMLQGGTSSVVATSYLSEDEDMLEAEGAYAAKDSNLQYELDHYEELHAGYDEYLYELDVVSHNPYVLISILTALHQRFQIGEVQDTLTMLFQQQYILSKEVTTEVRYREETITWIDEDGEVQTETLEVPYDYYICNVRLENRDLSHLPVEMMNEEKLSFYAVYMKTLGNRPDLFLTDEYPNATVPEPYTDYDIPPEVLDDVTFAAMINEAEKYLGFPYVWGGSKPSTSFDCSGFVSWVINHSGWNVGRRSAQGLFDICTPVSASNAKPGDLIFFVGTYDTPGVSHVGIYVGGGMMIHCGDPISYASINEVYWQDHFYCFGRLAGN